ncbi:MAG: hypothetical protein AB7K68_17550 [Bacteriovoracia bacterium]
MENSAENTENKEITPATEGQDTGSSFEEAVKESQEAISSAEPVKSQRGRKKLPRDEHGNIIHPTPKSKKEGAKVEAAKTAEITPPPIDYLKPVINFPFQALALRTGWQGWQLSEEEKTSNAVLLDLCMKRYLPQLQNEHAELVGLALGLGFAAASRYMAFKAIMQAHLAAQTANNTGDVVNTAPPPPAAPTLKTKPKKTETKETDSGVRPGSGLASFLDNGQSNPLQS